MKFANVVSWIVLAFICNVGGCSIEDEEVLDHYAQSASFIDDQDRLCLMECDENDCIVACID